ncbi:tyrosine-type recombinase/integrase [Pseudomonas sp. R5(2019)]|uniref:tyrosine-type recombinase/integrase n=1 Tax=Pseudomonas sp. R5(2019) TaxID=2697566 RepID=UPI00141271D0|nr:tyrosine-type recombinase/integrase [Pseudomonas sp. R5(2019)]NBA95550.1 tyrosine-type recombinase/integrase [Pseudomonas sp. R5(2019)]
MVPRPRNKANKGLPINLYFDQRRGTFRYRRPTDGKWFQFGADRGKAIDAAHQLNTTFLRGSDLVALVLDEKSVTLSSFLATYEQDILPPRELAKATLDLYTVRFKQMRATLGEHPLEQITIRMIAEFLEPLTARSSNQARAILIDVFNHAAAKGLCPDNPAANTIPKIEKKQRKRHTVEGLKAIRSKAPLWLQNAIDLALITAQRRGDILNMRFEDIKDGFLYVVQSKTEKASDAGWLKIKITEQLNAALARCRDDILSPYLVHRRPERKKEREGKDHWTKVDERFLTRAFKDARDAAGCYSGWKEEEMPGFHEIRAMSLHLYKRAGKDGQRIAGHATENMTRNYQKDHAEVVWSEVEADLDIGEFAG